MLYNTLKDYLGSARVITDASGNILGEQRYYAYGEARLSTGTINTDKLVTGQRDVGLGIYHYGARFYSPKLGRFLSADTIVPGAANPQAYNRYSYVLGNPLRYTDTTGHGVDCGIGMGCVSPYTPISSTPKPPPVICSSSMCNPNVPNQTTTPKPKTPVTGTPSPSTTPTLTQTPVCTSPTNSCATDLAAAAVTPTVTPTTTPAVGMCGINMDCPPNPLQPYPVLHISDNVDPLNAAFDTFGVATDALTLIPLTSVVGAALQPVASFTEGVGLVTSLIEFAQGDSRSVLYQQTESQAERVALMLARTERMEPVFGIVGGLVSLYINLQPRIEWVTP